MCKGYRTSHRVSTHIEALRPLLPEYTKLLHAENAAARVDSQTRESATDRQTKQHNYLSVVSEGGKTRYLHRYEREKPHNPAEDGRKAYTNSEPRHEEVWSRVASQAKLTENQSTPSREEERMVRPTMG